MVLNSIKQIEFPFVRSAYIANNYFGIKIITHLISENQMIQSFVSEAFDLLSFYPSTLLVSNVKTSLTQLENCLLLDSEFFESLYDTSFTPNYARLEQQIQSSILPQNISSTTLSKVLEYWTLWSNELLSDAIYLYSVSEFQMILKMLQHFYTWIQSSLIANYQTRILLKNHLFSFHFSILYCSSNIYYYQKLKTHTGTVLETIELIISQLQSNEAISPSRHQTLQTYFPRLLSSLSSLSHNRYSLWKSTNSWFSQWTPSLQYNVLLYNDTIYTPLIYADGDAPQPNTLLNTWSYSNQVANRKINWYFCSFYNNSIESLLWSNISSIFFVLRFESIASLPFLTIYTKNQQSSYWYGKRKNYTQFSSTPPLHQWVLVYYGSDPSSELGSYLPSIVATIPLQFVSDSITFKTYVGGTDLDPNDSILFLTLSTDSSASVQTVSFSSFLMGYKTNSQTILHRTVTNYPSLLS